MEERGAFALNLGDRHDRLGLAVQSLRRVSALVRWPRWPLPPGNLVCSRIFGAAASRSARNVALAGSTFPSGLIFMMSLWNALIASISAGPGLPSIASFPARPVSLPTANQFSQRVYPIDHVNAALMVREGEGRVGGHGVALAELHDDPSPRNPGRLLQQLH